jgi:hypothetical protein
MFADHVLKRFIPVYSKFSSPLTAPMQAGVGLLLSALEWGLACRMPTANAHLECLVYQEQERLLLEQQLYKT